MLIRFVNLSNEKIAIEKDLKSQIEKIKYEKNEYQVKYNEKELLNQKLLEDYANLEYIIQTKDNNIQELKNQLLGYKKFKYDDKIKQENIKEIEFLISQNKTLNKQLDEKERIITQLENEKLKITQERKYEKSERINHKDEKILYYENQLREANQTINKMNVMIKELEKQIEDLQKDINIQNKNKTLNEDYILLQSILKNKDEEIQKYINEINVLNEEKTKLYEDNTKMFNDIAHLQNEINKFSKNQNSQTIPEEKQNGSDSESNYSCFEFHSRNNFRNDYKQKDINDELNIKIPEIPINPKYKLNNIFKQNSNEYINTMSIEGGIKSSNDFQ